MSPKGIKGLRRIEWVILGVEDSTNLGIARGFCILAGLYLASMMDGTNIETPSAAVGYVFVSGFSAGADSTRDNKPSAVRESCPDRRCEAEANGLKGRELTPAVLIGNPQIKRGPSHRVA